MALSSRRCSTSVRHRSTTVLRCTVVGSILQLHSVSIAASTRPSQPLPSSLVAPPRAHRIFQRHLLHHLSSLAMRCCSFYSRRSPDRLASVAASILACKLCTITAFIQRLHHCREPVAAFVIVTRSIHPRSLHLHSALSAPRRLCLQQGCITCQLTTRYTVLGCP